MQIRLDLALPPGIWQVFWFGSLRRSAISAASLDIHAFFRSVQNDSDQSRENVICRLISMEHMHLLPIGRLIEGETGTLLHLEAISPHDEVRTFDVDLSRLNTRVLSRSSIRSIGPAHDWSQRAEYDGLLLVANRTTTTPAVVIPCACLFQFYWGVSSTLAEAVLKGWFEDLDRNCVVASRTFFDQNGIYTLEVRKKWDDDIVPYLATILADDDALDACRGVARHIIASDQMRGHLDPLQLEVLPPFPRLSKFCARVHRSASNLGQYGDTLFVTHIISADLQPKWTELYFSRENDSRRWQSSDPWNTDPGETYPPSEPVAVPVGSRKGEDVDISELPSGYSIAGASLASVASLNSRFPDLAQQITTKVDKDRIGQVRRRIRVYRGEGPWSAIRGAASTTRKTQHGKLVGGADTIPLSNDLPDDHFDSMQMDQKLSEFAELFIFDDHRHVNCGVVQLVRSRFRNPFDQSMCSRIPIFFRLPETVGGDKITWLYRDPNCVCPKLGFCVELACTNNDGEKHVRYLLDFESRIPKRQPTSESTNPVRNGFLVAWFDHPLSVDEQFSALRSVVDAIAINRNPSLAKPQKSGIRTRALRHSDIERDRLIEKIFQATNQSPKLKTNIIH